MHKAGLFHSLGEQSSHDQKVNTQARSDQGQGRTPVDWNKNNKQQKTKRPVLLLVQMRD